MISLASEMAHSTTFHEIRSLHRFEAKTPQVYVRRSVSDDYATP